MYKVSVQNCTFDDVFHSLKMTEKMQNTCAGQLCLVSLLMLLYISVDATKLACTNKV